jgi:hypothetical protein
MQQWRAIPVAIGGVVAVGFMDEDRVIVASHNGVFVYATSPTVYLSTRQA